MYNECQLKLKNEGKSYARTCSKCGIGKPCVEGLEYAQLLQRVKDLEDRAYKLAIAITGGEDAPGYVDSISTDYLVDMLKKERYQAEWNKYSPVIPIENSTKCPTCALEFKGVTGYVCTNINCPVFTVVRC